MTKRLIEYLPVFTIVIFYFGYCSLNGYYDEFHVDIHNYISYSEILMSFVPTLVFLSTVFSTFLIQLAFSKVKTDREEDVDSNNKKNKSLLKQIFTDPLIIFFLLLILQFLINLLLESVFNIREYSLSKFNLISSLAIILITIILVIKKEEDSMLKQYPAIAALAVMIFVGNQITTYKRIEARKVKFMEQSKNMTFKRNNIAYKTDSTFVFVGETQSTLFFYNRKDSTSVLYSRASIDSMIIK